MTLPTEIKKKKEDYIKESYMHDFFATKLLSDRELKTYLILIIAGILKKPAEEIERDFTYLDIRLGLSENNVNSVADLVVSFNMGYVSIEMNWTLGEVLLNKNMLYMCELLLRQAKRQEDYKKIKKVYQINFNNKPAYGKEEFITRSTMRSDSTNEERMCNPLEIYDVNMDYLGKKYYTQIKVTEKHSIERLLYIFVNTNHEELDEIYEGDEIMEAVKEKLYNLESELDRLLIYDRDKFIAMTIQEEMEKDYREEGRKEAKREEQKKRISSAKRLYSSGIPLETIIECLSLSSNESKLLKKDLV